jgi:putative hydrolase of HD superfamily
LQLWLDYETGSSAEAQVAKQLDKLEMIVQADEYEKVEGKRLQSFFDSTKESFVHPEVLAWANLLRERRDSRLTKNQEL